MTASSNRTARAPSAHFVHISDSHVQGGDTTRRHLRRLEAAILRIVRLVDDGVPIDFVVHTGDLVDDADDTAADALPTRSALEVLARLPVPWFVLGGNHDRLDFLNEAALATRSRGRIVSTDHPDKPGRSLDRRSSGIVKVPIDTLQLVFLNLNPEDGVGDLHGRVAPLQIDVLKRLLADPGETGPFAIFSHYPLLAQEALWTGRPDGAARLVELLERQAGRIAGVFAGHVHRGIHQLSNGVLHVSAPSLSRHFLLWPGQDEHAYVEDDIIGWHYVTIDTNGTRVQQHVFNQELTMTSSEGNY